MLSLQICEMMCYIDKFNNVHVVCWQVIHLKRKSQLQIYLVWRGWNLHRSEVSGQLL